jgi:hypothetical protein
VVEFVDDADVVDDALAEVALVLEDAVMELDVVIDDALVELEVVEGDEELELVEVVGAEVVVVVVDFEEDKARAAAPAMTIITTIMTATIVLLMAEIFTDLLFISRKIPFSPRAGYRYLGFATIPRSKISRRKY